MTVEGQEATSPASDRTDVTEQVRKAAIYEVELAQGFLGLVLAQLRTGSGDEQDRGYALNRFHRHAGNLLKLMQQSKGAARLDAMQAQGSA
jgi:hypothetical protein